MVIMVVKARLKGMVSYIDDNDEEIVRKSCN